MCPPQSVADPTLLDACTVLSLYATRRMAAILAVVTGSVAIVDIVAQEALYVRHLVDGKWEREPVDLSPLIATGALEVVDPDGEEEFQTFVDLAADLDDGEAMSAALAIHRRCVLVTDDRKTERLLASRLRLRSTLDLIRAWTVADEVSDDLAREVLTAVYERGYEPSTVHRLRPWWDDVLA